jgi:hypothetical protein
MGVRNAPESLCDMLRNHCAHYHGITVRYTPESLCGMERILHLIHHQPFAIRSSILTDANTSLPLCKRLSGSIGHRLTMIQ